MSKAKAISKLFKTSPNAARSLRENQEALDLPVKNLKNRQQDAMELGV
jgi:hypothetical protein